MKKAEEMYTFVTSTPLGEIRAAAGENALQGLWFIGQKYFPTDTDNWFNKPDHPIFISLKNWLKEYFSGNNPDFSFQLSPVGTDFQQAVWKLLLEIPYGRTTTYGAIAAKLASSKKPGAPSSRKPKAYMAAQAVGGAVGRNPISLVIPCHRVVGADGSLTGYAGGLEKKRILLEIESQNA